MIEASPGYNGIKIQLFQIINIKRFSFQPVGGTVSWFVEMTLKQMKDQICQIPKGVLPLASFIKGKKERFYQFPL